jgi:hypothetical protein
VKLPRLSIAKLMIVVAAIAINFGIARMLFAYHPLVPVGVALIGIALQFAVLILMYGRGRDRAFWAGFLAFGLMAMISFFWGMVAAPNMGIDIATGGTIKVVSTAPGSFLYTMWSRYGMFVGDFLDEQFGLDVDYLGMTAALIWSVPQLLLALVGGLLAHLIAGRQHKARVIRPDPQTGGPSFDAMNTRCLGNLATSSSDVLKLSASTASGLAANQVDTLIS